MTKAKKGVSRSRPVQRKPNKLPLIMALAGAATLIIAAFFTLQKKPASFTPEVTGGPSLKADKEKVDLGDIKLGQTVQVSFEIKNVGDQPLKFSKAPYIEVKEGCCPPTPVIGSMTLKPGETTTLSMQFMMHGDMGGKHDYQLYIPNNVPNQKDITLTVLSNWIP